MNGDGCLVLRRASSCRTVREPIGGGADNDDDRHDKDPVLPQQGEYDRPDSPARSIPLQHNNNSDNNSSPPPSPAGRIASRPVTDSSEDERASAASSCTRSVTSTEARWVATTGFKKRGGCDNAKANAAPAHPEDQDAGGATDHEANSDESKEEARSSSPSPLHIDASAREDADLEVALMLQRNKRIFLSRLRETVPRGMLALINLARRGLTAADALLLSEAIVTNPHLTVLKLSYNNLGDEGTTIVASSLSSNGRHHRKLAMLDLGFNAVGDAGCEALAVHALAGNYTLQALYLSGNQITQKGALSIAGAILHGTGLTRLHLSANEIGSIGLTAIAGAIAAVDPRYRQGANPRLRAIRELYFGNCGTELDGVVSLSQMILTNSSLSAICLAGNNLDDMDMTLLSQALTQNKQQPLEVLDLSFNNISCQGVECLMNAVWGSTTLRKLKLDNNRIKDRGAQLCAVVLTSVALQVLDLSFNCVTTVGIKALMKNLSENNSLLSLGLSGIALDLNASKAVSYALAYNCSLKALYLDSCSAGYASQRHIVAGAISNQLSSLRTITGFSLGPIATTLGVPRLPDEWSNDQVLGFFRHMWQQWLLKSRRGRTGSNEELPRGPAPPAAVAAAAKIALTSLGSSSGFMFVSEEHEKPLADQPPVESSHASFLERSASGTVHAPVFADLVDDWLDKFTKKQNQNTVASPPGSAIVRSALENPERRSKNLQWLRVHVRSLNDVGRLPFNNADLWQLHQYYFSPPINAPEVSNDADEDSRHESPAGFPAVVANAMEGNSSPLGRTVSFQSLGLAVAAFGVMSPSCHKRRPDEDSSGIEGPLPKRAKNLKPRIAFYPRIMSKIRSLALKPMDLTLSLLRQLKFTENLVFANRNPYSDFEDTASGDHLTHSDIEMILLDLL